MKHVPARALRGSVAIIRKGDDEDPASIVTKALEEFTTAFGKPISERLDALEKKGVDPELIKRLDKIEAKAARGGGEDTERKEAVAAELKAWITYLRVGPQAADDLVKKTLTVANDAQAGYLAPAEVSNEMIRDLVITSPIRAYASVRSSQAPSVKYPRRTGITNAKWEGEIEESEESNLTFGQTEIVSRRLTTFVDISNSLMMGSDPSVEAEVRQAFAEDFGQKESLAFVSGSGVKEPEGILTAAGVPVYLYGATTFGTDSTASDKLIAMLYTLPAYYRSRGVWLMNGTTIGKLMLLKDGQGRYLWQPPLTAGAPATILGRPVVEAPDMPDATNGKTPIVFGDLETGYRIVDRQQLGVLSDPYTQARNAITRMHGTRWVGGGVVQPKALLKLKMSAS